MTTNPGPYDATSTYMRLVGDGTVQPKTGGPQFWERLSRGDPDHIGNDRLITQHEFTSDWPIWEMHPNGDELVILISGKIDLILQHDGTEEAITLNQPGALAIVPQGAWHTARVAQTSSALFITPGEGTQHRPT